MSTLPLLAKGVYCRVPADPVRSLPSWSTILIPFGPGIASSALPPSSRLAAPTSPTASRLYCPVLRS